MPRDYCDHLADALDDGWPDDIAARHAGDSLPLRLFVRGVFEDEDEDEQEQEQHDHDDHDHQQDPRTTNPIFHPT